MKLALLFLFIASVSAQPWAAIQSQLTNAASNAASLQNNAQNVLKGLKPIEILKKFHNDVLQQMRDNGLTDKQIRQQTAYLVWTLRSQIETNGFKGKEVVAIVHNWAEKNRLLGFAKKWEDQLRANARAFAEARGMGKFADKVDDFVEQQGSIPAAMTTAAQQAKELAKEGREVFKKQGLEATRKFVWDVVTRLGLNDAVEEMLKNARTSFGGWLVRGTAMNAAKILVARTHIPAPFNAMLLNRLDNALAGKGDANGGKNPLNFAQNMLGGIGNALQNKPGGSNGAAVPAPNENVGQIEPSLEDQASAAAQELIEESFTGLLTPEGKSALGLEPAVGA